MPGYFQKNDLRVIKTDKAILAALKKLLEHRNFGRLTVNDLCEEALISRATFYAHYNDKYDLLKYWLAYLKSETISKDTTYIHIEREVNQLISDNSKVIANLIEDANDETLALLNEFIISILDTVMKINKDEKSSKKYIVLSNFCAGGIINLLSWEIKNKFPSDLQMINTYFYSIIMHLLKWEDEQAQD